MPNLVIVVILNVVQWLASPYLVGAIYRVKAVSEMENPKLHFMVNKLSSKSGIKTASHALTNKDSKRIRVWFAFNW